MALFVDNRFPLSFYYRTANEIVKEADIFRELGDSEGLRKTLSRYSRIISETIPHHPSYSEYSNELHHHKKILQRYAKEMENLNSQNAGENDGSSRCPTGCYRQSESNTPSSHTDRKDIYPDVCEAARRTLSTTSTHSSTTFQDSSINQHFHINVNYVKHYFPSPSLSCVEAPPVIGHVSRVTFPEPDKLDVNSSEDSSTSSAIKDLHISARLMEEFMELAKANTEKDLETCGILGASLKNHTYYITALLMPKQESTANSCQALNEEEIHAILDGESLYPAGWIHTHPSQTCFLSSIDVHTQYSYQVMLPEAVAIVMAPNDSERKSGIFRLSDPGGIDVVRYCPERGFHSHPETADGTPLYEICSNVHINPTLRFDIFDMRLRPSED